MYYETIRNAERNYSVFLRKLNNNLRNNQAILQSDSIPNNFYIRTRFSLPVYVDKLIIYRIKILRYQQVT